tara:strand:- start:212 stop:808 length:597 start_codon:yes stop_codon:yes gene_type:complete
MTRALTTSTVTNINANTVYPFFAVELKFDDNPAISGDQTLRMWTGAGTLTLADTTEWFGAGNLLNISSVDETSEIAARGADITLSAIPSEVISLALTEPYQGRECNIYFGTFDNGDQTTAPTNFNEIFSGYMDQMNISENAETSTVELKVENKLIDLERARVARFTSAYQKSKFPSDTGLDFIESMQDKKINWGKPDE